MVGIHEPTPPDRLSRYGIDVTRRGRKGLSLLLDQLVISDLDLMTIRDLVRYCPEPDDDGLIAVLAVMFSVLAEGSLCLCLDRAHLQQSVLHTTDTAVMERVDAFIRRLDAGRYDALIDRTGRGDFKPLVLDDTTGQRLLYFQKFHYHERRLKQRLISFLSLPEGRELTG